MLAARKPNALTRAPPPPALARLLLEPGLAQRLGTDGRERILAGFTPQRRLQRLREAIGVG